MPLTPSTPTPSPSRRDARRQQRQARRQATSNVGPEVVSPMSGPTLSDMIGPALADIPKARGAFGLAPNPRSRR